MFIRIYYMFLVFLGSYAIKTGCSGCACVLTDCTVNNLHNVYINKYERYYRPGRWRHLVKQVRQVLYRRWKDGGAIW